MSGDLAGSDAAGAGGRQFVTFQIREELFGLPLAEVQEIIRVPDLVQVPMSPASLEGIANLRGAVLPITSLRRMFGAPSVSHDDATRIVVVNLAGFPTGFVVDRMASVITAEDDEIEDADALGSTVGTDVLRGVVKRKEGMIMLLDAARLGVEKPVSTGTGQTGGHGGFSADAGLDRGTANAAAADEIQLVSFEAAGQEYAFPIEDVQEIVQVPGRVTQVPQTMPHVVGVMTLRERLLPLVSLRRMFALPEAPVDEHSRIVVISPGGRDAISVGIVMDTVKEVLRVNRALVDAVPPMLAGRTDGNVSEFEAICRLDKGKRLVTILSADRMFRDADLRAVIANATRETPGQENDAEQEGMSQDEATDDEEQFVIFRLAGEEYGVPIETVQEIVRIPDELTRVPKTATFIEGVVNLRGTVLPVIDQRRRFALQEADRNDRQRIMVLTISGVRTGFIVDSVSEVLKIARRSIERAPTLSEEQARLIRRVANLEAQKRMILLLDPANLLDRAEVKALESI